MTGSSLWPVRVYDRLESMASPYSWPVRVYGQPVSMASSCLRPDRVYGLAVSMAEPGAGAPGISHRVRGYNATPRGILSRS